VFNCKNFEAYFHRLNVNPKQASLLMVSELQQKHLSEFCFNNLAVLLARPISLDISDIINKIVVENKGGYCFEHNKLIHDALLSLGYNVRCLIAKVLNNQEVDTPRTHRICLLEWEGDHYLIDVGFGPNTPREPIKIEENIESRQNRLSYRIVVNSHQDYQLELITEKGFFSLYTFNLNRYTEADCMIGNYYSSHHPDAVFVNNLVVSRILPEVTLSLRNDQYYRIGSENTETHQINDHWQLNVILNEDFNIALSEEDSICLYQKVCAK